MKKIILGFIIGVSVCGIASFTLKQSFHKMIVKKIGCDPDIYPDCDTDCYSIETFDVKNISVCNTELHWCFTNKQGNTVKVILK